MTRTRWLLAVLLSPAWLLGLGARPASACTCFGADMLAQFVIDTDSDTEYVAFYGSVVDSGDSDVTALWAADPPRPGLALLFEVSEVRVGDMGRTAIVHTPGGRPMSGDCSVGVLSGKHLVVAQRGTDGHLAAGMCGFFPGLMGESTIALEAVFEPGRPPDPNIPPASLSDQATRAPDPESPGALERYEKLGGTTAAAVTTTRPESAGEAQVVATPVVQDERSQTQIWLLSGACLTAAIALLVYRDRRQRGNRRRI